MRSPIDVFNDARLAAVRNVTKHKVAYTVSASATLGSLLLGGGIGYRLGEQNHQKPQTQITHQQLDCSGSISYEKSQVQRNGEVASGAVIGCRPNGYEVIATDQYGEQVFKTVPWSKGAVDVKAGVCDITFSASGQNLDSSPQHPLFSIKCPQNITADLNSSGQGRLSLDKQPYYNGNRRKRGFTIHDRFAVQQASNASRRARAYR